MNTIKNIDHNKEVQPNLERNIIEDIISVLWDDSIPDFLKKLNYIFLSNRELSYHECAKLLKELDEAFSKKDTRKLLKNKIKEDVSYSALERQLINLLKKINISLDYLSVNSIKAEINRLIIQHSPEYKEELDKQYWIFDL